MSYLPFTSSRNAFVKTLQHLADPLELGEKYAIVGPASRCDDREAVRREGLMASLVFR